MSIHDPMVRRILSYPRVVDSIVNERLNELAALGVDIVYSYGSIVIDGFRVLGKGCDSIIVLSDRGGDLVSVKIRRMDSGVNSLTKEAENLMFANAVGVGPRLIAYSTNIIIYEYINGIKLSDVLKEAPVNIVTLKKLLLDTLIQCYLLDRIGLDHGELSRAHEHILVRGDMERTVIIDFGNSSRFRKTRNVSSVSSFLFFSKNPLSNSLVKTLNIDRALSLRYLRRYMANKSWNTFIDYLRALNIIVNSGGAAGI